MTQEEVRGMIEATDSPRNKALLACLYLLGPRITEALTLKKADIRIDEDGVTFKIRPLKRRDKHSPLLFRHSITIPLGAPFMNFFTSWAGGIAKDEDYLFPGYGPHLSRSQAWRIVHRLNPKTFPHFFRHTRLSWVADASGGDAFAVRDWAGRKTIPVEYVGRRQGKLARLARKIA